MYIRSNFKLFWDFLAATPLLGTWLNQFYTGSLLASFQNLIPRVPRMNLEHDYPSYDTAYDEGRTVYSRVLPRKAEYTRQLPDIDSVAHLFERVKFVPDTNTKLNLLIAYYAQWFSHQFFNTNPGNPTHVNQPVGLNTSQLYGSTPEMEASMRSYKDGLFKSTIRHGKEFPEIIPKPEGHFGAGAEMFRMPIALANMIPGFAAIHVVFFRHHQHVARRLKAAAEQEGKQMSDEEIFQKAKLVVTFIVLKITMNDYVAEGLQSSHVKVQFDPQVKQSRIYKMFGPKEFAPVNAIQTEFNFLYRWHFFYPDTVKVIKKLPSGGQLARDIDQYECDGLEFPKVGKWLGEEWNSVKWLTDTEDGLDRVLYSASCTRAGRLELLNVNKWLVNHVIKPGIEKTREYELASYNDYREYFGYGRLEKFEDISDNRVLTDMLKNVYGTVDNIEYYPGIFAEQKDFRGVHGPWLAGVGVAFTYGGIFASRLWEMTSAEFVTEEGMKLLGEVSTLQDLTKLHTNLGDAKMNFKIL